MEELSFRFSTEVPLRHTDTFGGTPFVHGGVLLALTERALMDYDRALGVESRTDVLRFQRSLQFRFRSPLRWTERAMVELACTRLAGRSMTIASRVLNAASGAVVAEITHEYVFVEAQTGTPVVPPHLAELQAAVKAYEPEGQVSLE